MRSNDLMRVTWQVAERLGVLPDADIEFALEAIERTARMEQVRRRVDAPNPAGNRAQRRAKLRRG